MSETRQKEIVTWVAVPDDGVPGHTVTWHATREPVRLDGWSSIVSPTMISTLCRETLARHQISRASQLSPEIYANDRRCTGCVVLTVDDSDDKKKLATLIVQIGDDRQTLMVDVIRQTLRMFADGAAQLVEHYEHDARAREWVDLVKRAAADLRAAEARVQIQQLTLHGGVPS